MFPLYRAFTTAASPLIDLYLKRRRRKGREDAGRFKERLGFPGISRPEGKLIWFHGASIGEATSVLSLINLLLAEYPNINILVTTGTVTSAKLLQERLPRRAFHQYVPVDRIDAVRRFINHWRPDTAFWIESELWPNLISEAKKHGCKMVLLNGRISDNSFRVWGYLKPFAKKLLGAFSLCLAQSELDAERLSRLGAQNVKYLGNLKYDSGELTADPKEYASLMQTLGERLKWLAASTHPGEEMMVKEVHLKLKNQYPDLLTVIVPRHPGRGPSIAESLKDAEVKVALRSRGEIPGHDTDIYIADTIGELGIFYRLCGIVFMGGSLVKHGGQNPLEPARLEAAIVTGPYHHNFTDIYGQMVEKDAVTIVDNKNQLATVISRLLGNYEICAGLAHNAVEFTREKGGVAESCLQEIKPYLS